MSKRPLSSVSSSSGGTFSSSSGGTVAHHSWVPYTGPVMFTGPSGLRNHRVKVTDDFLSVGIGTRSKETTNEISYLSRKPPGTQFPRAKNGQVGEIGWEYENFGLVKGI